MIRRDALSLAATLVLPAFALGQPRPVQVIVGFPAGGPVDIAARLICPLLSARMGQPFVVDNIPGDSGNIATGQVAKADADGLTLLLCGPVNAINSSLFPGLPFDFAHDLAAVASLYRVPLVVEVHPGVPVRTANEFLAYARNHPGRLRVGYAGDGTPQHLGIALFKSMAAVDLRLVPYLGSAPALEDLLAGRIDVMFDPLPSSIDHIRAGRLRPLAVTGTRPIHALPGIPAMSTVVPGYVAGSWFGICAPRGTSSGRIEALNAAVNQSLRQPEVRGRLDEMGATGMPGTAQEFAGFIRHEIDSYARVIASAGISVRPGR